MRCALVLDMAGGGVLQESYAVGVVSHSGSLGVMGPSIVEP